MGCLIASAMMLWQQEGLCESLPPNTLSLPNHHLPLEGIPIHQNKKSPPEKKCFAKKHSTSLRNQASTLVEEKMWVEVANLTIRLPNVKI